MMKGQGASSPRRVELMVVMGAMVLIVVMFLSHENYRDRLRKPRMWVLPNEGVDAKATFAYFKLPKAGTPPTFTCAPNFEGCEPEVYLMPSHPTSGNGMVQHLFHKATGTWAVTSITKPHHVPVLTWPSPDGTTGTMYTTQKEPENQYTGTGPTLMKFHHGYHYKVLQRGALVASGAVRGLVRLVRNPGDHVYRDTERWKSNRAGLTSCHYDSDSNAEERKVCDRLRNSVCAEMATKAYDWASFNDFWARQAENMPVYVVRYEDFLFHTERTCAGLFDFMNIDAPHIAEAVRMVHKPSYVVGTEMEANCGIDVAAEVDQVTSEQALPLGYSYKRTAGHWEILPFDQKPRAT